MISSNSVIIRATLLDLDKIKELESLCFPLHRREEHATLVKDLKSSEREIWVIKSASHDFLHACLMLRPWRHKSLRIYSIGTHPSMAKQGLGQALVAWAKQRAIELHYPRLTLEADANNYSLLSWYEKLEFRRTSYLRNFYQEGEDAWRMVNYVHP